MEREGLGDNEGEREAMSSLILFPPQGEVGAPGHKGSKGDKGDAVSVCGGWSLWRGEMWRMREGRPQIFLPS